MNREEQRESNMLRYALDSTRKQKKERATGRPRFERRQANREALLPEDRRCPCCGKVRSRSRQWVVDLVTVCLSCFRDGCTTADELAKRKAEREGRSHGL